MAAEYDQGFWNNIIAAASAIGIFSTVGTIVFKRQNAKIAELEVALSKLMTKPEAELMVANEVGEFKSILARMMDGDSVVKNIERAQDIMRRDLKDSMEPIKDDVKELKDDIKKMYEIVYRMANRN